MRGASELLPALALRVVSPLLEGGAVRPLRPIGFARAETATRSLGAFDTASLDPARVRSARHLAAVDVLPSFSESEALLACALNDLLQAPNLDARRAERLLALSDRVLSLAGAPGTVAEALARFATFRRVPELSRVDTVVVSPRVTRTFRGRPAPARAVILAGVRRLSSRSEAVPLFAFAGAGERAAGFLRVLGRLFATNPLLDLHAAGRPGPAFLWTESALALLGVPSGRVLARRAVLRSSEPAAALSAVERATERLSREEHRAIARDFLREARESVSAPGVPWDELPPRP
jgi:hypothetical protein